MEYKNLIGEYIVKVLFEPESLVKIDLNKPEEHLRLIEAYSTLERLDGFICAMLNSTEVNNMLDEGAREISKVIERGDLPEFWPEHKPLPDAKKLAIRFKVFSVYVHRANKLLNRYGLKTVDAVN